MKTIAETFAELEQTANEHARLAEVADQEAGLAEIDGRSAGEFGKDAMFHRGVWMGMETALRRLRAAGAAE